MGGVPNAGVGLVVPVKPLAAAKSRLRGAADRGVGDPARHAELALALALDTLDAAHAARSVSEIIVVTTDVRVAALVPPGLKVVTDEPGTGLNAALAHGADLLEPGIRGALQADLPALRPEELDAAIEAAAGGRAFCADARGDGTTLLLTAAGGPLDPRFGPGSAAAHLASGAAALSGALPGLRRDVDTEADLREACTLGVGPRTDGLLVCRSRP
ncbi:2-phospho-L-lactate guanylyltransferase [Pseudonocardia ailaonensis]|uniref:Phosphoenolpyruvate guanylyltransferase n=1 Tax=Pseudonocardia ailaonensis TaxID=367279 RepID=A0ABN2ND94_9PSEU